MTGLKYKDPADGQYKNFTFVKVPHSGLSNLNYGNTATVPHTQYTSKVWADSTLVAKTGGSVAVLEIQEKTNRGQYDGGALLHYPGAWWGRLKSGVNPGYTLRVESGGDQATLVPMQAAYPTTEAHASTVQYAADVYAPRINGPHGGNDWAYYPVAAIPGSPWPYAIYMQPYNEPGRFKLTATTYLHINGATATSNIYWSLTARWSDGAAASFRNGVTVRQSRLCVPTMVGRAYHHGHAEAWVENRPGYGLIFGGHCSSDGTAATWEAGNQYRVVSEFWPYSTGDAGLNAGWISW